MVGLDPLQLDPSEHDPLAATPVDDVDGGWPDLLEGPTPAHLSGVTQDSLARLLRLGILEPVHDAAEASLVVMSTRLRRADVASELSAAAARGLPVVVLAHTGGEAAAVR